jgi:hypothetical protein
MRLLLSFTLAAFLLFGCTAEPLVPPEDSVMSVVQKCQLKCSTMVRGGVDMSPGPCVGVIKSDWVCDVAHSPRQPVDDLPENQCADFREGRAHHFVEVDTACELIRYA